VVRDRDGRLKRTPPFPVVYWRSYLPTVRYRYTQRRGAPPGGGYSSESSIPVFLKSKRSVECDFLSVVSIYTRIISSVY